MSGEIPVGMKDLETIVTKVAADLLEHWAIEDRFNEDQMEEAAQMAIDDTVFVINSYMQIFNELITLAQTPKLV